jgi:hypothetical protein
VGSNPGTVYWLDVSDLLAITLNKNGADKKTKKENILVGPK